ncbi:protein jagged-2-like [Mytilus galloprovincialis]|uniref:protein jagged-2-like n=1 Tax=Mytilus galloprovincialis TaxID=29158 RepID=UPI003F7BCFEE
MFLFYLNILLVILEFVQGSGYFEIQIITIHNPRGEVMEGECCDGVRDGNNRCVKECNTMFRVCLKEYQSVITFDGKCTFGNITSSVFGGNSFTYPIGSNNSRLKLHFEFAWTLTYSLTLEAWDQDARLDDGQIIERASYSGILLPGPDWYTRTHNGPTASLIYRIRVVCDIHYYNTTCTKFCRPRNDTFGHYKCDSHGDKVCMEGWMGSECDKAICKTGCSHGSCDTPGECRCAYGWQGELCDLCIPYPGCKHGSCNGSPWQCFCDLNWGGTLCDQDLNFCGRHHPCTNGGICLNSAPNQYDCKCPPGYSGNNCQRTDLACTSSPCLNEATCENVNGGFRCHCLPGWSGSLCEENINECQSNPCLHEGTCVDDVNEYHCQCLSEWQGPQCQLSKTECSGSPCVNAHTCEDMLGDYICHCLKGWKGKNCDININDCHYQCQNGGRCIDLVADYHCSCTSGYTGRNCENEIMECNSNPCKNRAKCHDQIAGYSCECVLGYSGFNCEIDIDPCFPNPCRNGASCFNLQDDFYCHCTKDRKGRFCDEIKTTCDSDTCQVIDSCTIALPNNNSIGGVQLISSNVCGKHGICISRPGGQYSCVCDTGFTGAYCHENINDCLSNPCQNSGTCVDMVNSFQCICKEGYEGLLCNNNKNDCYPNPCRNRGSCLDLVADFICQCPNSWKGKTCALRDSHCDNSTCLNKGKCIDLDTTFTCQCPDDYDGSTCQIRSINACDNSPCRNHGTCVNSGDTYTCLCKEGFEGSMCEININDCNPFPCYNGGRCIDGENWYICECANGFAGPDCRVNINECISDPCTFGSTCVDGIGSFKCICPPGRTGALCAEVAGKMPSPLSCLFNRRTYPDKSKWEHECNSCSCENGVVTCSQIWCGPSNCLNNSRYVGNVIECSEGQTCVIQTDKICFTPPCVPWGHCEDLRENKDTIPYHVDSNCESNSPQLSNNCAKILLIFDKSKTPAGVSVETICNTIRRLPVLKTLSNDQHVYVVCNLHKVRLNAVDILLSVEATKSNNQIDATLKTAIDNITQVISHKQTGSSALAAVVEVEVLMTMSDNTLTMESVYLIPVICSAIGVLGIVIIALLVVFHVRQKRRFERSNAHAEYIEQRTNNENEENLRRYKNPLFSETNKGAEHKKTKLEKELDKIEKSPMQIISKSDSINESSTVSPPKTKVKDINIELSKSRAKAAERQKELIEISKTVGVDMESEVMV